MKNSVNKSDISVLMIVLFFPPLQIGGSETQALRLSEQFVKKGLKISVVTVGSEGLKKHEVLNGINIYRVSSFSNFLAIFNFFRNKLNFLFQKKKKQEKATLIDSFSAQQKEFGSILSLGTFLHSILLFLKVLPIAYKKRNEFDIIHVHTIEMMAFVAALLGKLLKKKVIVKDSTMNGLIKLQHSFIYGKHVQKFLIKNCHFVAMTNAIFSNYIIAGANPGQISLIPNGISIPCVKNEKVKNEYMGLFVGNLTQQPAKGVDILLKAWKIVINSYPQATLLIVGKGNSQEYYDYAEAHGLKDSVKFPGKQSDLQEYYLNANVFVLPSRREGMSNALLEAMSYGLPCIATDISGNQDLIEDKINGMLVSVEDINGLAECIIYSFNNYEYARAMGVRGREKVKETCDINIVTSHYIEMYKEILNK